jgi:hypothetical protein
MVLARFSLPMIAGLALASVLSSPAPARTNFDGNWSVLIVTRSGPCDRAFRYGVAIRNGAVFYEGSLSVNLNGRVSNNGQVSVRVSAGSQGASGSGKLSRNSGSGSWRGTGSMSNCAGSWTAERR